MSKTKKADPDQPARSSEPTVAIAFGGGGARGIAHIHIIETLDAMGIRPVAIAGSSIGAIMGAAMASGLSGEEIRAHTLETIGKPTKAFSRMWQAARPRGVKDAMEGELAPELKETITGHLEVLKTFKVSRIGTIASRRMKSADGST